MKSKNKKMTVRKTTIITETEKVNCRDDEPLMTTVITEEWECTCTPKSKNVNKKVKK